MTNPVEAQKSPLAEFMIRRRQELGLNQLQLKEVTGVSSGTIASIESGYSQAPKADTLQKLSKGLQVSYQELDCIVRGVPYEPKVPETTHAIRDFEMYLTNHPQMPREVGETIIEMVRTVLRKYE